MKFLRYIERINLLDKLMKKRRTGTPAELAKRLGVSVARLYVIIDQLKDEGAPIVYSRQLCTYFYEYYFSITIKVQIEELGEVKSRNIYGGEKRFNIFSSLLFLYSD
ncbi:HTH domain-containing protein [Sphingobacterium sp.]|uniref:HTH domain-containing protein n=1 Tax=Sphingobacterium sp. TaxID=341027 RepID=UPI0031D1E646